MHYLVYIRYLCLELTSLVNEGDHNKDLTCAFSFDRRISQTRQNVLKFHRRQWSTQHNRHIVVTRWTKRGCCCIYLPPNLDITLSMDIEKNPGPSVQNIVDQQNRNNISNSTTSKSGKLIYSRQQLLHFQKPKNINHLSISLVHLMKDHGISRKLGKRGKRAGRKLHYGINRINVMNCEKFRNSHETSNANSAAALHLRHPTPIVQRNN